MKNKLIALSLIAVGCIIIYIFAAYAPITKNLNAPTFFKGFALGCGAVTGSFVVVVLIKGAIEKSRAV